MSNVLRAGIVGMLLAHLFACSSEQASDSRASLCRDAHDHVVELELASSRTPETTAELEQAHRAALQRAMSAQELDDCRSEPEQTLRCVLDAKDLRAASKCGAQQ